MNIELFRDITTEEALQHLEAEGLKLNGLYLDMEDKEQRKYVKNNAVLINELIKKVDRSRINQKKAFGLSVEAEAKAIIERLEAANLPFTLLIDEHKAKRAKILADQKAKEDAAELLIQIEADHESAIMWDKVETFEKVDREKRRLGSEQRIASEAAGSAIQKEQDR
jgi:hypothetical protein